MTLPQELRRRKPGGGSRRAGEEHVLLSNGSGGERLHGRREERAERLDQLRMKAEIAEAGSWGGESR